MKFTLANYLLRYVKLREQALTVAGAKYGHLSLGKLRSIAEIRKSMYFYIAHNERTQAIHIVMLESHIRNLLPSKLSRFHRLRESMIDIIMEAKSILATNTLSNVKN